MVRALSKILICVALIFVIVDLEVAEGAEKRDPEKEVTEKPEDDAKQEPKKKAEKEYEVEVEVAQKPGKEAVEEPEVEAVQKPKKEGKQDPEKEAAEKSEDDAEQEPKKKEEKQDEVEVAQKPGKEAVQEPEVEAVQKPEKEEKQDPEKEAAEKPENLANVIMFAQVVRRINPIKEREELLPDDDFHGRHFTATDGLYNLALEELPSMMKEYTGTELKYEEIKPYTIHYPQRDRREVNMVYCRATFRPFWIRKVDDKNYMIYRETLDA